MVQRFRFLAILAAVLLVSGVAPAVAASAPDQARAEHQRIVDFWTVDKVAKAVPRDFVREPSGKFTLKPAAPKPKVTSVVGASWNGGGLVKETTGKVLFAMGTSYYVCSASVARESVSDRSIILTAGHCVYDNETSSFATNWMFIPDYDQGAPTLTTNGSFCADTEYGCWTASSLVVHQGFASETSFSDKATLYDFAFAVVGNGGKTNAQLDATVGSQAIQFLSVTTGVPTYLFGYPAASPYTGKDLVYSAGALGTDPYNANLTYRVTSNMTGGCSGGPWFSSFNPTAGTGTMMSVNSYGYSGVKAMHGPKLNGNTEALFNAAKTAPTNEIIG